MTGFIKSGQNVVLQGERRMGKTSLLYETVRQLKRYRMLYVDLLEIKTADDLCKRMIKASA
jgi:predicted AAA+ superfamily ATPase